MCKRPDGAIDSCRQVLVALVAWADAFYLDQMETNPEGSIGEIQSIVKSAKDALLDDGHGLPMSRSDQSTQMRTGPKAATQQPKRSLGRPRASGG